MEFVMIRGQKEKAKIGLSYSIKNFAGELFQ